MINEQSLEQRLRKMRDHLQARPSMAEEVMHRIERVEIAPGIETRLNRLLHSRTPKWAIPIAAAAGVVLAVGLWPHDGKTPGPGTTGRLYAMSDVPALFKAAKTLYIRHRKVEEFRQGHAHRLDTQTWLDATNGRFRFQSHPEDPLATDFCKIINGQYMMKEWSVIPKGKTDREYSVRYERVSPYMVRLTTQAEIGHTIEMFANIARIPGFAATGQETIDGVVYDIYEGEVTSPSSMGLKIRVSLCPVTGQLRNCRMWVREPGKKNWRERIDFDQIDRDVPLSENLFSTEARPGAKMMNTKETAQLTRAGMASGPRPKQGHRFDAFLSFTLPDGTELVVWTCQDAEQADQTGLFGGLTPGGDLPSLPHTLMSLTTIPPTPGLVYTGRHLAWTKSNGVCYEWAIYVPNGAVPNRRDFLTYSGELRDSASPTKPIRANIGDQDIVIETREDFDRWILDGMAELSDTGERPKGITYESVLQLAATIRLTLPREAQSQATPVQQAR